MPAPTLQCEYHGISVLADRDRMGAVISHLVQNAQEATPHDGSVQIRLLRDERNAVIEVEDTGSGMDEAFVRERLFKPFDTTKGNAGMGIGVYESREFIHALGGEVVVNSTPGKGTVFHISLPLLQRAAMGDYIDQNIGVAS